MNPSDAKSSMAPTSSTTPTSKSHFKSSNGAKTLDAVRKQAVSPVEPLNRKQSTPQPKAWQGTNPITQRSSSSTPNGTEKPLPKLPSQAPPKSNGDAHSERHSHDRLLFLLANMTGLDVTLTLKNGEQFTGIFSGGSFEASKSHYLLKMVKQTRFPSHQHTNGQAEISDDYVGEGEDHAMTFNIHDTADLEVQDLTPSTVPPIQNGSTPSSFRTDTEISSRDVRAPRERELQRWQPGGDSSVDMSLESSGETGWDQFAANERMYGVRSTYDENFYTTAIDRNDPEYRRREARAAQIAREIEGSAPANAHVAEERRRDAERGDGMDEEEKYSGVKRDVPVLPKRGAGSYVPPSQRPLTSAPTIPGAPFDPAIISLAKPTPSPTPIAVPERPAEATTGVVTPARQAESSAPSLQVNETTVAETTAAAPATPALKKPENTTEDHVRGTVDAFKQFANTEKLRIRQVQEAKRSSARHEKNVKLNDLKKFAANFKLNSRVPDDLVPILAKDREKQLEIQRKADEAAKDQESKSKEKEKEKAASAASPATSSIASQATVAPTSDPRTASFNHTRGRNSQQMRMPSLPGQGPSPRQPPFAQRNPTSFGRGGNSPAMPSFPADLRIPAGPANATLDRSPLSPSSATRLNVNAFEFRPSASNFTPSGSSPSPQRMAGGLDVTASVDSPETFFAKGRKMVAEKERKDIKSSFNPLKRMAEAEYPEEQKKSLASNGGIPQPYRTFPTWHVDESRVNVSYKDSFPKAHIPSEGTPPLHAPNNNVPMPYAHQLPGHTPTPHISAPLQRPPYFNPPTPHGQGQHFDHRVPGFGPNGSVQSSPRFPPAQMAFNGHMAPQMGGPQFPNQPMPGYGMSPSMPYRQMHIPPGGPMMMPPGQQQQQPQQGQMPPMRQGYPQGPQFGGPQMTGQMMAHNSSGGGYMNGPMPPQSGYSPMPPHVQPHMPHMQHVGPSGYSGSPRPPMMQQQGSHQGFQPPMHMHPPPFAPSPGQQHPHPYHLQHQQRQMSSGPHFPQMTPRQQNAIPQHPSPGMSGVAAQGDEGK